MAKIVVVGAGEVGTANGIALSEKGHDVTFVDVAHDRKVQLGRDFTVVTPQEFRWLKATNLVIVTVPTPTKQEGFDYQFLDDATTTIGLALRQRDPLDPMPVVVYRSTMPPGTCRRRLTPKLQELSGLTLGVGFGVGYMPDFSRHDSVLDDTRQPRALLLGSTFPQERARVYQVFRAFKAQMRFVSLDTAEFAKYAGNIFEVLKVVYFNEMRRLYGALAAASGAPEQNLADALHFVTEVAESLWRADHGIADLGAHTGAPAWDLEALLGFLDQMDVDSGLLREVHSLNRCRREADEEEEVRQRRADYRKAFELDEPPGNP